MRKIKRNFWIIPVVALIAAGWVACNKSSNIQSSTYKLSYGDSIIYLKPQSNDYIVYPTEHRTGTYSGFPDGIEIDDNNGAINVSKSETGLRYRITHVSPSGNVTTAMIVISGITFTDHFYYLTQGDSLAKPVYNADKNRLLPVSGSIFDEGNNANSGGCSVTTTNGQINLAQSVRNGIFGSNPQNDVRKDFDINYRLNDQSGKSLNKLRVRLYWYNTITDVPADLWEILNDRQNQGVFLGMNNSNAGSSTARGVSAIAVAKPRPPCIIIVGQ